MKLRKKMQSDDGAAVTILALALLVLFLFISVFMVDFVKNSQIKSDYTEIGSRATEAALIHQNGVGGLLPDESAQAFVKEYMIQSRGQDPTTGAIATNQTVDTAAFRNNGCSTNAKYPIIKLTYNTKRTSSANETGLPTATSSGGSAPVFTNVSNLTNTFAEKKYRVISAEITDVSDNFFYGMFGQPCQEYTIKVSSVAVHSDNK